MMVRLVNSGVPRIVGRRNAGAITALGITYPEITNIAAAVPEGTKTSGFSTAQNIQRSPRSAALSSEPANEIGHPPPPTR